MATATIPVGSPYSVTPGAVPPSLLPGQLAANLPDRRLFAGAEDGTPVTVYDPVAPQVINLSDSQPGLTLRSGNATGGMSDTVPVMRMAAGSGGDGWDWRWTVAGELQQVRRVGGVDQVIAHYTRAGGISFGGVNGSDWFTVSGSPVSPNRVRLSMRGTGVSPQLAVLSPDTDRGLDVLMKGAGSLVLYTQQTGIRSLLGVHAPANLANGLDVFGAAAGGRVLLATNGTDPNVSLHVVTAGTGEISFGGGRPGWSPSMAIRTGLANTDSLWVEGSDGSGPVTLAAISANLAASLLLRGQGTGGVQIDGRIGFGVTPIARQTITGSRSDGTAFANLLAALELRGDFIDATTI